MGEEKIASGGGVGVIVAVGVWVGMAVLVGVRLGTAVRVGLGDGVKVGGKEVAVIPSVAVGGAVAAGWQADSRNINKITQLAPLERINFAVTSFLIESKLKIRYIIISQHDLYSLLKEAKK
jgi:hypothetical protein